MWYRPSFEVSLIVATKRGLGCLRGWDVSRQMNVRPFVDLITHCDFTCPVRSFKSSSTLQSRPGFQRLLVPPTPAVRMSVSKVCPEVVRRESSLPARDPSWSLGLVVCGVSV